MFYSKSCEISGNAGKRLCFLGLSQDFDSDSDRDVGHEVVSIFVFFSLNQNLLDVSIFLQILTLLVVLDAEILHAPESDQRGAADLVCRALTQTS